MRLSRVRCAAVAAVAVAGAGLFASSGALAASSASTTPRWRIVGTTAGTLNAVVAPSRRTQWAFGVQQTSKPKPPVALRHAGSRWVQAVLPATTKGDIVCAGASSPSNIWAFEGGSFIAPWANSAAALQLRSGHWVMRREFDKNNGLFVTGCNVLSPTDVWAFGSTGANGAIGTWHLHGRRWTHTKSSPADVLGQASVISPSNIWATGWDGIEGLLAHWNGSSWKTDTSSLLRALPKQSSTVEVQVAAVTAISSSNLWVEANIGREGKNSTWNYAPQVEHWNGARWSKVSASGFGYYLPSAFTGTQNSWSAGYPSAASATASMTYLLHASHGHWVKVPLPKAKSGYRLEITSVANVPGSRVAYAVGNEVNKTTGYGTGVILKVTY